MLVIYPHLAAILETDSGGFRIELGSKVAVGQYLREHGFQLALLLTYRELLECLRYCNARDLERTLSKPSPHNELRLLWRGMRRCVRLA